MKRKIKYYTGYQITKSVLNKIKLIDLKKIQEGTIEFSLTEPNNIKELCEIHESKPQHEHIILGEDWYILYIVSPEQEVNIADWVALNHTENKFVQATEMYNALKKILIQYNQYDIYAILRHSTSYSIYKKTLEKGLLEEVLDIIMFDDETKELEDIKYEIYQKYNSIEEYLEDPSRNKYEEYSVDDHIYHEIWFNVTDKFKKRYQKQGDAKHGNNKGKSRKRKLL